MKTIRPGRRTFWEGTQVKMLEDVVAVMIPLDAVSMRLLHLVCHGRVFIRHEWDLRVPRNPDRVDRALLSWANATRLREHQEHR